MYFDVIYVAAVAIDAGYRTASRYPWSDVIQITRGLARPTGKAKGVRRSEVKSQPTSSLMHLCITGDRNDIGPSLLFIFRSPCWSSRPLPMLDRKIAAVPADDTMRRDVRPSSAVSCSFPCLPSAPSQTRSLRYIHGRTRPSGRSNISPSIDLHRVFGRSVTTIPRDLSRDRSLRRSRYGRSTDRSIPLITDHSLSRVSRSS